MIDAVIPATFARPSGQNLAKKEWMHKGTTTLAFVFQGGVIVAVDSRASMGSIISSQTVMKIIEINDYMLGTMAGCAADCSYWERHLTKLCRLHEVKHGERVSVIAASKMLANIMYYFRGYGLSMGTMIAGWDHTGPKLCCVMDDGSRRMGNLFSVGSGSLFAYGVIDDGYRYDLTIDEAIQLGKRGIYQATLRDGGSGGLVTVYHIHENGWTRVVDREDVSILHRHYAKEKGYVPKRAILRPPKPERKTPKGPILHRRERAKESNQLRDELIMKYWRRIGREVNEVPFNDQTYSQIDSRRSFISMYVIPKLAEISYLDSDILLDESKSSQFTRESCLQFLNEIRNFFITCSTGFNKSTSLKPLVEMGPMIEIQHLSNDIKYLMKLTNSKDEFTTNNESYITFIERLGESDPVALISHAYYFYKEWSLCKFHILNSIKLHLRITRHFQSAGYNEDVSNFEAVINLLSENWSMDEKNNFINNLSTAYEMSKCFTKLFN